MQQFCCEVFKGWLTIIHQMVNIYCIKSKKIMRSTSDSNLLLSKTHHTMKWLFQLFLFSQVFWCFYEKLDTFNNEPKHFGWGQGLNLNVGCRSFHWKPTFEQILQISMFQCIFNCKLPITEKLMLMGGARNQGKYHYSFTTLDNLSSNKYP